MPNKRSRSARTKTKTKVQPLSLDVSNESGVHKVIDSYLEHEQIAHQQHQEAINLMTSVLENDQKLSNDNIMQVREELTKRTESLAEALQNMRVQLRNLLLESDVAVEGGRENREHAVYKLERRVLEWCPDDAWECYVMDRAAEAKRVIQICKKREKILGPRSVDYIRYIEEVRKPLQKLNAKGVKFDKFAYDRALAQFAYLDKFWEEGRNSDGEICQTNGNCKY